MLTTLMSKISMGGVWLLYVGLIALTAAYALSWGATSWWVLDLATHFRGQYVVGAAVLGLLSLVLRHFWAAGWAGVLLAANLLFLWPYLTPLATAQPAAGETLKLLSANLFYRNQSPEKLLELVQEQQPDLVLVMEMGTHRSFLEPALAQNYPFVVGNGQSGAWIFSRWPLQTGEVDFSSPGRPNAMAQLFWQGELITIVAVHTHAPFSGRASHLRNLHLQQLAHLAQQTEHIVIAGDFNVTPFSPFFQQFLTAGGLKDGRVGQGLNLTWPTLIPLFYIPIDQFVSSPTIQVQNFTTPPYIGSDHRPILVEFALGSSN